MQGTPGTAKFYLLLEEEVRASVEEERVSRVVGLREQGA